MSFVGLISLLVVLANVLLGLFVLMRNYKNRLFQAFFLLAFSLSFWVLASWQAGLVREGDIPLVWEKLSFAAGALIVPCFLYFSLLFTERRISFLFKIFTLLIIPIFFIIFSFTPFIVKEIERFETVIGYKVSLGFLFYIYAIYFVLYALVGFVIILSKYKSSFGILRLRIKYLFIGLLITAVIGIISNLIFPFLISVNILKNNNFYQFFFHFGHFSTIFFVYFTAYAILRYRLMDIKVVLRKGLIYGLSLIIGFAFYTYLVILGKIVPKND